jgi:hypothetical protein
MSEVARPMGVRYLALNPYLDKRFGAGEAGRASDCIKRARPVSVLGATTALVGPKSGLLEKLGAGLTLRAGFFATG